MCVLGMHACDEYALGTTKIKQYMMQGVCFFHAIVAQSRHFFEQTGVYHEDILMCNLVWSFPCRYELIWCR